MINVDLLPHQYNCIHSPYKFTLLLGGVGAGKTFTGVHYCIHKLVSEPGATGFIGANTYQQLKDVSVGAFIEALDEFKIPYSWNKNEMTIEVNGTKILCRSMDNHERWKGIEIGWFWLDEVAYSKRQAYETVIARLRDKRATRLQGILTTTPKGYNWLFDYFAGDLKTEEHHLIRAATRKNRFLPEDYEESIAQQYDSKLIQQELEGEFVNVFSGQIYYGFDRDKNTGDYNILARYPLWVGCDFNVNPMTAVVGQVVNDVLYIVDEFYLTHSNTSQLANEIKAKYGTSNITIVPDSTGIKTTTNSSRSDHQILKDAGFKVSSGHNPFRIDRYAAVNVNLEKEKILIDNKCKYLIKDLEQVAYKEGTNQPDTSDKMLTHISDAMGYLAFKTINPFHTRSKPIRSQLR